FSITLNGRLAGKFQAGAARDRSRQKESPMAASEADAAVPNNILRREMMIASLPSLQSVEPASVAHVRAGPSRCQTSVFRAPHVHASCRFPSVRAVVRSERALHGQPQRPGLNVNIGKIGEVAVAAVEQAALVGDVICEDVHTPRVAVHAGVKVYFFITGHGESGSPLGQEATFTLPHVGDRGTHESLDRLTQRKGLAYGGTAGETGAQRQAVPRRSI